MPLTPNPALPTWPSSKFGCATVDPQIGANDPVVRSEMDYGQKARQRYINVTLNGRYRFVMSNIQYRFFQSWHKFKISNGAEWFNFPIRSGDSLLWEEVKMTAMYQAEPLANKFVAVTFPIITRTDDIPDESSLDVWLNS